MSTSAERRRALRARRVAALMPVDGPVPLPESERLLPAVGATLAALELGERDAAVAALARRTASLIDQAENQALALRALGPLMLRLLVALHATPASRPAAGTGRTANRDTPNAVTR